MSSAFSPETTTTNKFKSPINLKGLASKSRQKVFSQSQFNKQVINFQKTSIFYNDPGIVQNSINKLNHKTYTSSYPQRFGYATAYPLATSSTPEDHPDTSGAKQLLSLSTEPGLTSQ